MDVVDLGKRDYKEVWDIQRIIHQKHVDGYLKDTLLLVEHDHVLTLGKSSKETNILITRELLDEKGVACYEIERGGDVTYHGPGQLVGYPILNIKRGLAGIRPYIECLEDVVIKTLQNFSIVGRTRQRMIGVWTDQGKVCSIGVAVKRWVSFHGFALNVNTDLSYFNLINPCGMPHITMTSMQEILGQHVPMEEVKRSIIQSFKAIFKQELISQCLEKII